MELFAWPHELSQWIAVLAQMLDARTSGRLGPVFWGLLFSHGRRTVAAWLRGAEQSREFRRYYYFLGSVGRKTEDLAARLVDIVRQRLAPMDRILLAIDDTPTKRFGPKVQGAGIHHNPTPGPAGAKFVYGHVWVTLAWLVRHPTWGAIALPLLAKLYVRAQDVLRMPRRNRLPFRTKLEQAAELIEWAQKCLAWTGIPVWCVTDGAYANRPFLKRALAAGVVVVSRLRHNAALFDLPLEPKQRKRGQPRKYGVNRLRLARSAAQRQGWQTADFVLYGKTVTKTFKTFLATWRPAGGVIRVVLVREERGWIAFFATNPEASVQDILEAVSDRFALEQVFHDIKEIHGAGQQQLRSVWANIAAYHLILWMHTLTELWAWTQSHGDLCDRSDSPWDDPNRRPSHADRLKALRRTCLDRQFSAFLPATAITRKIRRLFKRLVDLAISV